MKAGKKSLDDYRTGASGALIDEYERALFELKAIAQNVSENDYTRIADTETKDEDCRSIQTIISHVVRSGYGYANYIRKELSLDFLPDLNRQIAQNELGGEMDKMFDFTIEIFEGKWKELSEQMRSVSIKTNSGVVYNLEQMLQHAIVHVLRHRRQIDKFLLKFDNRENQRAA